MALQPFQWIGNQAITSPEQAARQRAIAEALIGQSSSPASNWAEGLGDVAAALSGTVLNNRVSEAEAAGRERAGGLFADLAVNSDPNSIIAALTSADSAWASPAQTSIASALLQSGLERQDPMYQLQLQQAQLELDRLRNPAQQPFNPDAPTDYQNWQLSQANPSYGEWLASQPSGQTINVGGESANIGTIPPGYAAVVDPTSPAGYRFERIPGSAAEAEALAAEKATDQKDAQTDRYGGVVTEDIGRALDIIEKDPTFTTGIIGQALTNFGGSPANRVENLIETVKSNVGFDRLQAMRESSPTGGALGSVTERELSLLTSAIGSLEQSNNADDLVYNLRRVNRIYMDIIHGPGNWDDKAGQNKRTTSNGIEYSY